MGCSFYSLIKFVKYSVTYFTV